MLSYKPFIDEARAIAKALSVEVLTKQAARPLRRQCLAWLDNAPVNASVELQRRWGTVVAGLVRSEDALLRGVASIQAPRAPAELLDWLDWIAFKTPGELFATSRGRYALYESVCTCGQALREAPEYSMTLHAAVSEHRWNAAPLLGLLSWCRDAHRSYRQTSKGLNATAWPEDIWVEALLGVARHTSWRVPDNPAFHALWAALAMYGRPLPTKVNNGNQLVLHWSGNGVAMEALIVKLAECLPQSAADALSFAQAHPRLLSKASLDAISQLDIRQTSPMAGLFAWLRMHAQPAAEKEPIEQRLREQFPEMAATLRSYVQMVPEGQSLDLALTLLPAWKHLVLGQALEVPDEIAGDLFSA